MATPRDNTDSPLPVPPPSVPPPFPDKHEILGDEMPPVAPGGDDNNEDDDEEKPPVLN
jgi:hypothetical protein